jgi:23S rRNA (adenine1618-N6)-methyltransferase
MWKPNIHTGLGFAHKAVWSRAARRQAIKESEPENEDDDDAALGFKIYVEAMVDNEVRNSTMVRWLKGKDPVLFESFCGMLKRKLDEVTR